MILLFLNFLVASASFLSLGSRSGGASAIQSLSGRISFQNIPNYWAILDGVINVGWEPYDNSPLLASSLIAILLLFSSDDFYDYYMISWFITSFPLMLMGNRTITFRVLYNLPLQFLAIQMIRNSDLYCKEELSPSLLKRSLVVLLVCFNILFSLRFGTKIIRNMFNYFQ
jgi:hypothetical protein